jgi:hypothetical protein
MGKEKKQYPKITKKSLDYLDEVEKNREVTFQSLDVFGRTYTESSVKGTIKNDLKRIPLLKNRYKYLCKAKAHINQMNANTHLKEELDDTETIRLGMVHAYYPLKNWVGNKYDEIATQVRKKNKDRRDAKIADEEQITFQVKEEYIDRLQSVYNIMKEDLIICSTTNFEDFQNVFLGVKKKDVKNKVIWNKLKTTLIMLFYDLMLNKIVNERVLSYGKDNPLNLCFLNHKDNSPFKGWRSCNNQLDTAVRVREYKVIDKIKNTFLNINTIQKS